MNNQGFIIYNTDSLQYEKGFCVVDSVGKAYKIELGTKNKFTPIEHCLIQYDTGCKDSKGNIIYSDSEIYIDRLGRYLVKLVDGEYRAYSKKDGSFEILNMIADKSTIVNKICYIEECEVKKFIEPYYIIRGYVNESK